MIPPRFRAIFALFLLILFHTVIVAPSIAQDANASATHNLKVRAGPGKIHAQVGSLTAGQAIIAEARVEAGDWLLVRTADGALRGWVATSYVAAGEGVDFAALPVSGEVIPTEQASILDTLRATPIVPAMTGTARAIYQRGLARGNNPNRFSKVGDCQNIEQMFLGNFDAGLYDLGPYADLQTTIDYFAESFGRDSKAVAPGFNVYSVLDPAWASSPCANGESPQECEYRLWTPSFAIISLEITSGIELEGFESSLRQIIDYWISQDVVPILATKADNREGDWSFNATIAQLAWDYDLPLWNFMMAAQPLPEFGLTDGFHLTFAGDNFGDADAMQSAWPWRNLTALQTLDAMRRAVN